MATGLSPWKLWASAMNLCGCSRTRRHLLLAALWPRCSGISTCFCLRSARPFPPTQTFVSIRGRHPGTREVLLSRSLLWGDFFLISTEKICSELTLALNALWVRCWITLAQLEPARNLPRTFSEHTGATPALAEVPVRTEP